MDLWDNILSILALSEKFFLAQKKLCSLKTESVSDSVKLSVEAQSDSGGRRLSSGTFFMENCHCLDNLSKKKKKKKKKISVVKPGVVVTLNISAASSYGEATHKKGERVAE